MRTVTTVAVRIKSCRWRTLGSEVSSRGPRFSK